MPTQSKQRHHTVIVNTNADGSETITLEKDWWNGQFAQGWQRRMIVESKVGTFHIVGDGFVYSPMEAQALVARILRGNIQTIDLREMSVKHYPTAEEKRRRR